MPVIGFTGLSCRRGTRLIALRSKRIRFRLRFSSASFFGRVSLSTGNSILPTDLGDPKVCRLDILNYNGASGSTSFTTSSTGVVLLLSSLLWFLFPLLVFLSLLWPFFVVFSSRSCGRIYRVRSISYPSTLRFFGVGALILVAPSALLPFAAFSFRFCRVLPLPPVFRPLFGFFSVSFFLKEPVFFVFFFLFANGLRLGRDLFCCFLLGFYFYPVGIPSAEHTVHRLCQF